MSQKEKLTRRDAIKSLSLAGVGLAVSAPASAVTPSSELAVKSYMHLKQGMMFPPEKYRTDSYEAELYGPEKGTARFLFADPKNPMSNAFLLAKMPAGTCYTEHHHSDWEVIFVIDGEVEVQIKEWESEKNPHRGNGRKIEMQESLEMEPVKMNLSVDYQKFRIKADGWIQIPGFTKHIVTPISDAKIMAYLPDAHVLERNMDICEY